MSGTKPREPPAMPTRRTNSRSLPDLDVPGVKLYFRPGRGYYVEVTRGGKRKQISLSCPREEEAVREARQIAHRVDAGVLDPWASKESTMTLGEAASAYMAHDPGLSASTLSSKRVCLGRMIGVVGRRRRVSDVTPADLFEYVWSGNHKPGTRRVYLSQAKAFFRWCELVGACPPGYTDALAAKTAKPKVPKKIPKVFSPEAIVRLIERAEQSHGQWLPDFIRLGLFTGGRRYEMIGLRWEDVNLSAGTLSFVARDGRGMKTGEERTVPLFGPTRELVLRRMDARLRFPEARTIIFCGRGRPISPSTATHLVSDIVDSEGMDAELSLHALRHTFVSRLLASGTPPRTVMEYTGHKSWETFNIYSHFIPSGDLSREESALSGII